MKKVPLALAVVGLTFLAFGSVIALVDPLLLNQQTIRSYGRIEYLDEESESTESNSETYVDVRGYIPIIVGVGLLSIAFLDGIVKKKRK